MSKGVQIAIGALLIAGLVGWLGASQSGEASFTYFQTLGELGRACLDRSFGRLV